MREKLEQNNGIRSRYAGTFEKFGKKTGWNHPEATVLLVNIRDDSQHLITDHLWFNYTKEFKNLWESGQLKPGSIVEFYGRVAEYEKGYEGYREDDDLPPIETDYKLTRPTKVKIIGYDLNYKDISCEPPFEYAFPTQNYLNFSHDYDKLHDLEFTTIRGKSAIRYYQVNSQISILLDREKFFCAKIIRIEQKHLLDLSLEFLQRDMKYNGFCVSSHKEFLDGLNSFRRDSKQIREENPLLTVIYLKRTKDLIAEKPVELAEETPQETLQIYKPLDFFLKDRGALPL